jgi:hypothetical protein
VATQQVGRLIGGNSESPLVVVNYSVHGEDIVVRIDTEALAVTIGDVVTFEVDTLDERTRCGWSVVVSGVVGEVTATDKPDWSVPNTSARRSKGQLIAIRAPEMTGRLVRSDDEVTWVDPRAFL